LDLQLPVQSVPVTTKVVSSNPVHGKVYSIQYYLIKFVSDLRRVSGFLWVLRFPPPIKLTATNKTEILLIVALNTINLNYEPPIDISHLTFFCYLSLVTSIINYYKSFKVDINSSQEGLDYGWNPICGVMVNVLA